ncbi:MAG: ABC transporter ATP-binding protein [Rhodobacteraceae bacterium]|nr:ABC transporter ATP-binding protein [Paracoccaceae bacterium]
MLELRDIDVGYGQAQVLRQFSLNVEPGEIHCLMGRNGAGKTTTMKAIMGILPLSAGSILVGGVESNAVPAHKIPGLGIGYVPQGRRLFSELTVAQNLDIGLMAKGSNAGRSSKVLKGVLEVFPRLRERMEQRAQTLSGGEQQMLATARALCIEPDYLLLDEPTEGLQPSMIESIKQVAVKMRDRGVGVLLVEQHIKSVLSMADRVTFIENGRSRETVKPDDLRQDGTLLQKYVGL